LPFNKIRHQIIERDLVDLVLIEIITTPEGQGAFPPTSATISVMVSRVRVISDDLYRGKWRLYIINSDELALIDTFLKEG